MSKITSWFWCRPTLAPKSHISSQEPMHQHHLGTSEGAQRPLPIPSLGTQALLLAKILKDWCTPGLKGPITPGIQLIFPLPASIAILSLVQFVVAGHKSLEAPIGYPLKPHIARLLLCKAWNQHTPGSLPRLWGVTFSWPFSPLSGIVGHPISTPQFLCMQNGYDSKVASMKCS